MTVFSLGAIMRAAAISIVLGATAASAMPAQAQSFSFGFSTGRDSGFTIRRPQRLCLLTDFALRRAIGSQGYHNIYLNVANNRRIQARATQGRWVYLLVVDTCTGRVLSRERLRRR
jgi:hypothetical protein